MIFEGSGLVRNVYYCMYDKINLKYFLGKFSPNFVNNKNYLRTVKYIYIYYQAFLSK